MAAGRPTKYNSDIVIPKILEFMLAQQLTEIKQKIKYYKGEPCIEEYEVGSMLPTTWLLAEYLDISVFTIQEWDKRHEEFSAALKEFRELQKHFLIQNTLRGHYKENFSIFMMKNMFDWTDTPKIKIDPKTLTDDELIRLGKIAFNIMGMGETKVES